MPGWYREPVYITQGKWRAPCTASATMWAEVGYVALNRYLSSWWIPYTFCQFFPLQRPCLKTTRPSNHEELQLVKDLCESAGRVCFRATQNWSRTTLQKLSNLWNIPNVSWFRSNGWDIGPKLNSLYMAAWCARSTRAVSYQKRLLSRKKNQLRTQEKIVGENADFIDLKFRNIAIDFQCKSLTKISV